MKKLLPGLLLGIVLGFLLFIPTFYLYVRSGLAPVTIAAKELPLEHLMATTALHAKMDHEFPKVVPIKSDEKTLLAATNVYRENCAVCHGLPNSHKTAIAAGMFPRPPQLFMEKDLVTDDPPGETFWKAKYGIRLSGMPGFESLLSDDQIWQVSVLLASADKLSPAVAKSLIETSQK